MAEAEDGTGADIIGLEAGGALGDWCGSLGGRKEGAVG